MGGNCEDTKFDRIEELNKKAKRIGSEYMCPICEEKLEVPWAFED